MRTSAILVAMLTCAVSVTASEAATLRVPSEYPTINTALSASVAGDTVLVAPGAYADYEVRIVEGFQRAACAFLVDGVVLRSEQGPDVTTIDLSVTGLPQPHVVYGTELLSGETVVEGFAITGEAVGASAVWINESERVEFRDCIFHDINAGFTGAIVARISDLDVIDCVFSNCSGSSAGGIYQTHAKLFVSGCEFTNCSRAIFAFGEPQSPPGELIVEDTTFLANSMGTGSGGAVLVSVYRSGARFARCYFEDNEVLSSGGAASVATSPGPFTIEDSVFWNNRVTVAGSAGGALSTWGEGTITGCTFVGNSGLSSPISGTIIVFEDPVELRNNIIAGTEVGVGVETVLGGSITGSCNVFWDNPDGNANGYDLDPTDRIVDPEFCDPVVGDFTLRPTSPCLPAHSSGCGLIGSLGEGCGVVSVAPESWGSIKANYLNGGGED